MPRFGKKFHIFIWLPLLVLGIFCLGHVVAAQAGTILSNATANLFGTILGLFVSALGLILVLVLEGLVSIASYQHFIDAQAVVLGWVIVRDICNMFFVVVLMVIAFATILDRPEYSYKKLLPKLILMAVLINFSKTICGLLIDVSQVVMLTFVNAFKDIGAANITNMLGIQDILTLSKSTNIVTAWTVVGAYVLGLIYLLVAIVVLVTMMMMLVMRLVMIWIYVVLSPAAYLLAATPGGQNYSKQWWDEFIKNLIVGPVLAFFIWLSIAALQADSNITAAVSSTTNSQSAQEVTSISGQDSSVFGTAGSTPSALIKYVIAIGMLVGGLMVTQSIGGAAGKLAGKGMGVLQKGQALVTDFAKNRAKGATYWAGRKLDTAQMALQKGIAGGLGVSSYRPKSLNVVAIKKGWEASSEKKKEDYYSLHGGAANNWHDTFNKYTDLKQYGSIRKNLNTQTADNEAATELETENVTLGRRRGYTGLSAEQRRDEIKELERDDGKERINEYLNKAPKSFKTDADKKAWAEEQYNEDRHHLEMGAGEEGAILKKKEESNQEKIEKLRDVRTRVAGVPLGFVKTHRAEATYGAAGDKERQKKEEQEMSARTGEDNFSLVSELIKAFNEKDSTNIACAFNLLAKNNDLNEALKDNRVASLMTKNNGILEKLAMNGTFGQAANSKDAIETIKTDYSANRVTPAYLQALVQGMFEGAGTGKDLAGRYANQIGHTSFANGNGIAYAMADGNASSGEYEFSELSFKDGKVRTSDARKAITTAKFNTMESQTKMRMIHPDTLIAEDASGKATGITDDGLSVLRNTNAHDLGQINRMRPDVIKKIGNSRKAMSDLVNLVATLEKEGNTEQARNIKYFTWYIQQKKEGKGIKDMDEAIPAGFEELKKLYV